MQVRSLSTAGVNVKVIACGGDGTVMWVASILIGGGCNMSNVQIGVMPFGAQPSTAQHNTMLFTAQHSTAQHNRFVIRFGIRSVRLSQPFVLLVS